LSRKRGQKINKRCDSSCKSSTKRWSVLFGVKAENSTEHFISQQMCAACVICIFLISVTNHAIPTWAWAGGPRYYNIKEHPPPPTQPPSNACNRRHGLHLGGPPRQTGEDSQTSIQHLWIRVKRSGEKCACRILRYHP